MCSKAYLLACQLGVWAVVGGCFSFSPTHLAEGKALSVPVGQSPANLGKSVLSQSVDTGNNLCAQTKLPSSRRWCRCSIRAASRRPLLVLSQSCGTHPFWLEAFWYSVEPWDGGEHKLWISLMFDKGLRGLSCILSPLNTSYTSHDLFSSSSFLPDLEKTKAVSFSTYLQKEKNSKEAHLKIIIKTLNEENINQSLGPYSCKAESV